MANSKPRWRLAQFGAFEVDRDAGVLLKQGLRLKLQDQPFRILSLLLDRRGEVVTRDEIRQMLWPDGTHVDFNHSLNAAVAKLRRALGDSADTPRFIETLAKRGYRFTAPAEFVASFEAEPPGESPLAVVAGASPVISVPSPAWKRSSPLAIGLLSLFVSLLIALRHSDTGLATSNTSPIPLTSFRGTEKHPTFSPNGSQLAFEWDGPHEDNTDIYVKAAGEGEPLRLTSHPSRDEVPAWSPDGRWIAFVRRSVRDFRGDVYVVPPLGGVERKVGETVFSDSLYGPTLAWTNDGRRLAVRDDGASIPGLYLISIETGEKRLLLERPAEKGSDRGASFSHDGRQLAISRFGGLYVVELDGWKPKGLARPLTHDSGVTLTSQAWSPDQKYIYFQRRMSFGVGSLWRARADGAETPLPIANAGMSAFAPAVSSGGSLAYAEGYHDANIWRLRLRGPGTAAGSPEQVISSSRFDGSMSISPDGSTVAFTSNRTGTDQIWIAATDGSRAAALTGYSHGTVGSPRFSPDGKTIAYDRQIKSLREVYLVPAAGGASIRLAASGKNFLPSWSADGTSVYLSSERDGQRDIWKRSLAGEQEIRITQNGGIGGRESPDGRSFAYFTPTGTLWLAPVVRGIPDERRKLRISDRARLLAFDISSTGIYFGVFTSLFGESGAVQDTTDRSIYFFDFATHSTSVVATLERPLASGLVVSPDDSLILVSQLDRNGSDIMLLEGFQTH